MMSDQSNNRDLGNERGDRGEIVPRRRVNKINDLLDQLPANQKASLMNHLQGTAPQLINPQASNGCGKPIDTPMRRAKAIARQLTRGELSREHRSSRDEIETLHELPLMPLVTLLSVKGRELLMIYQASPLDDWLCALKIAEIDIKEHLLIYLPSREKSFLEDALRQLGPVKLSQAQEASRRVMRKAQELIKRGEVKSLVYSEEESWLDD